MYPEYFFQNIGIIFGRYYTDNNKCIITMILLQSKKYSHKKIKHILIDSVTINETGILSYSFL